MRDLRRLGSIAIVVALFVLVLTAGSAVAAPFAAKASVQPQAQFLRDSAGTVFTFTVHNTGTSASIGGVAIVAPSLFWTVSDCPLGPTGWSTYTTSIMCLYRSQYGTADDILPGDSNSQFQMTATTGGGQSDVSGTFQVYVSKSNWFVPVIAASAEPPGLTVTAHSWQILDALLQSTPATPGSPCPAATPANHSAVPGTTGQTIVICGKNRTNLTLTPTAARASLGGTFIASHGAFSSGPIGARSSSSVVLGNWANVTIASSAGAGKTVVAKVGSAANKTSPLTTLAATCPTPTPGKTCLANGGYEALNQPPNAVDDFADANEDGPAISINVMGNDSDPEGAPIQIAGTGGTPAGTVGVVGSGSSAQVSYDPNGQFESLGAGQTDADAFTYTISDAFGATDTAGVTVTIHGQNDPPVANADAASTDADAVLIAPADGVLGNDTDVDAGDTKTVSAVNGNPGDVATQIILPSGALLTLNADGSYAYDPNGQFNALNDGETAQDSFDYTMRDSQGASSTALVTVTIHGVPNQGPVALDQSVSTDEDPAVPLSIALTGTDADDDDLTFSIVAGQGPLHGTLGAIGAPDCTTTVNTCTTSVGYDPDADFNGQDSFKFTVNDGQADSNQATVQISVNPVNDAPSFTAGGNVSVVENSGAYSAAWATAISAGPADESAQTLSFITSNTNPSLFSALPAIAPDGTLSFTPATDASGTATLSVVLMDDGGTANGGQDTSAPVSFDIIVTAVTPVNAAPINTVPGPQSVDEDTDLIFSAANGNALSVADVDAGVGDVQVTVSALNGTITPAGGSGAAVSGSGTASATITGTLIQVNAALDGLKYKGNLNFNSTRGSESLTLLTNDQGNTGSGGPLTDTDTVDITVNAVNDPPIATAKSFSAQANMKILGLTGLLTGATDPDTGDGGYTATFNVGTTGATTPAGGTISNLNNAAGSFDFDPPPGATGDVTFTYTVCDSGNPGPSTCSAPATVTVSLAGPAIWFVNPAAGVNGDGRLSSPFNSLASADAVDASGHSIFLYSGTATSGITLNTNEWLIGQGVTGASFDSVFSIAPPAGTIPRPSVGGTRPVVQGNVAVATSDAVRGLNIEPPSGTAGLTGSGAISLTAGEVSVTTNNAAAVNLSSSGGTLSLTSISANGGSNGIVLNNTTGTFAVTGSGGICSDADTSGCSGGTIQNMTGGDDASATPIGAGVVLNNAAGVSLTRMYIHDHSNYGIRGTGVDGLTLDNSVVSGVNGNNAATPFNDGSLSFDNLSGTSAITNSAISGGYQRNVRVDNTAGTLSLTVNNSSIHDTSSAAGDDGLFVEIGGGNATLTVTDNTFSAHGGDHFNLSLLGSPTVDLTFSDNLWTGGHPIGLGQGLFILGASFDGTLTYDILNNGTVANPLVGNRQGGAMHVNKGSGTGTFSGTISNNVIGDPAVNGSGSSEASGIDVEAHGSGGSHTTVISNNLVRQFHNDGILVLAGEGNAALNATVTGNTVSNPDASIASFHGMHFNIGTLPADALPACLDVKNNSLTNAANEANGGVDLRMRQRQLTTVRLPGYAGANNDNAAVQTFLSVTNSNAVTTILASNTVATGGAGYTGGAACPQP